MKAIKKTLLFILLLVISLNVFSQKQDYIVTLKGDTAYGHLLFFYGKASKLFTDSGDYNIKIENTESYYSAENKSLSRRRMLPEKKRFSFVPLMETGAINLYVTLNYNREIAGIYCEKIHGELINVWNRRLLGSGSKKEKENLLDLIKENKVVAELCQTDKQYEPIDVQYYIHQYNITSRQP